MQFKILNQAFRNMKTKHDMLECVNYHRLLLGLVDKMKQPYSMVFFFEFLQSTVEISMQLILVTQQRSLLRLPRPVLKDNPITGSGPTGKVDEPCLARVPASSFAFTPVCPSTHTKLTLLVSAISAEICSNAVYESEWYDKGQSFKKDTLFLMLESQKKIAIDALGFFQVGREAFVTVCRSVYSIYTLLLSINH
ncbi:uncharacterized protein [Diabrotica undecimpunctata]|uniref:uncharacterized protein n=1 Tax=Diabrotica undecimpunctata TaxID=50387 RepID=UPI003B636DFE